MAPQWNSGADAEAELPEYTGQYRLESCLGSGGMGVVHLARSTSGLRLAVKVVHAGLAKDREFRGRFRQEVAAARRVSGAFTASVVDADPTAARPWMATLFIPGPTLSEYVKRNGPMDPGQLRRLMAGLAEALRDIHRVGVVHRDLKPSNVLLAEDGPKVIDFGISRPVDSELRTETGKLIGSPPFMAPEQFRRPREVGPAADIFALGAVLVHAATGRGPFDSESPYVVAYQVVHDEPDLTGVPESLAPLVRRCLAKEPEDRPTPDELMLELRSAAASYETQAFIPAQRTGEDAVPDSPPERRTGPPTAGRKIRKVVLGAGALCLVLAGSLVSVKVLGDDGSGPPHADPDPQAASFSSWENRPAHEAGMPQCAYGVKELLCAQSGVVYALSPIDGKLLWRHSTPVGPVSGPPVMSAGLVQPHTSGGTRLDALDPGTGSEVWKRKPGPGTMVRYAGGTALLTGTDGVVTGVDGATGEVRWRHRFEGQSHPSFVSLPGDPLAYATSSSGDGSSTRVLAVDPQSGDVRWRADHLTGTLKLFAAEGDSVLFLAVDRVYGEAEAVVRYSPRSGAIRRVALPQASAGAHATVHDNVAYLLAAGGSLSAVDLGTRKELWRLETSVSRGSTPVTDGKLVYFTAADGRLLAADARTGALRGQTPARLGANSSRVTGAPATPVLVGHHVYATAPDGTVFAVDGRDPAAW